MRRNRHKGAQMMIGQIFIYVVSVIVVGMILIYGYGAVRDFIDKQNQISDAKFEKEFSNTVSKLKNDYGSIVVFNDHNPLTVNSKYSMVCFAETGTNAVPTIISAKYPLIYNSVCGSTAQNCKHSGFSMENVFLVMKKGQNEDMELSFEVPGLRILDNSKFVCANVTNNKIYIQLKSQGETVELSVLR